MMINRGKKRPKANRLKGLLDFLGSLTHERPNRPPMERLAIMPCAKRPWRNVREPLRRSAILHATPGSILVV